MNEAGLSGAAATATGAGGALSLAGAAEGCVCEQELCVAAANSAANIADRFM
jgi:hypothetical protein